MEVTNDRAMFIKYNRVGVFGYATSTPLNVFEFGNKNGDYQRMFALMPLIFAETFYFPNFYTMLIPEEEQKGIWKGSHSSKAFFVSGGKFQLGEAVRDRYSLWDAYFQSFTSYKAAQTKDPRVIDYEVSLDLSLFCAYGRPVDDFISK